MKAGSEVPADLESLLRALCAQEGAAAAAALGTVRPSERATEFVHVEPVRLPSFRAIEVRPRQGDAFGIALPELADGAVWSLDGLAGLLGPLEPGPRTQGPGPHLQGFLDDPALPARAAVYVILASDTPGAPVEDVRIRIESR